MLYSCKENDRLTRAIKPLSAHVERKTLLHVIIVEIYVEAFLKLSLNVLELHSTLLALWRHLLDVYIKFTRDQTFSSVFLSVFCPIQNIISTKPFHDSHAECLDLNKALNVCTLHQLHPLIPHPCLFLAGSSTLVGESSSPCWTPATLTQLLKPRR